MVTKDHFYFIKFPNSVTKIWCDNNKMTSLPQYINLSPQSLYQTAIQTIKNNKIYYDEYILKVWNHWTSGCVFI